MDWRLLLSTFLTIFLAEMGDKTQLATMGMASASESKWSIFIGASLALIATTALGVVFAGAIAELISPQWLKRGAGILLILMGAFYLWESRLPGT